MADRKTQRRVSGHTNRRNYIAGLAASSVVGLAGCLGDDGDGDDDDDVEVGDARSENTLSEDELDGYEPLDDVDVIGFNRQTATYHVESQQLIEGYWQDLGLGVSFEQLDLGPLFERFNAHDFDMCAMNYVARPERLDPTMFLYPYFHSDFVDSSNSAGWEHEGYDEAVELVNTVADPEERREHVYRCQEILAEEVPHIFCYHQDSFNVLWPHEHENWQAMDGTMPWWNPWTLRELSPANDEGTTVSWATTLDPPDLNPMDVSTNTENLALLMNYDRLVRIGFDLQPEPWAAEEVEAVDGSTFRVTIRDDMVFHDGEPVTVEDVKFSMDYYIEWQHPYYEDVWTPVDNVEILDDQTVQFNLNQEFAPFEMISLSNLFILPEHVWGDVVEEEGLDNPTQWTDVDLTGSGPFQIVDHQDSESVTYETFDDHFHDFEVEELFWDIYGSEAPSVGDVETGARTFAQDTAPALWDAAQTNEDVETRASPTWEFWAVSVNSRREPFNDRELRKALSHAIDRDELVDLVFYSESARAHSPIAPANEFFYNDDIAIDDGGLERAEEILVDAGYKWDQDGTLYYPTE